jgi:hypothetical protein
VSSSEIGSAGEGRGRGKERGSDRGKDRDGDGDGEGEGARHRGMGSWGHGDRGPERG